MNKIILVIVSVLFFSSCDFAVDGFFSEIFKDIPLYYGDFTEIENEGQISPWINARVEYKKIGDGQSPKETLRRGEGDCDSFVLLYMNILYVRFGIKSTFCLVVSGRNIVEGGFVNHAIIRMPSGRLIEAQQGKMVDYSIGYEYSFDHVFK